jgi:antitoxin component YwqK of YwqJK toxin-antitoxin module
MKALLLVGLAVVTMGRAYEHTNIRVLRWSNGSVHLIEHIRDGVVEGTLREWLPDGTLYREQNYLHGHEEGRQRMWYGNGKLRANYVVRSGRRYGLMGAKGCTGHEVTGVQR